MKKIIFFFLALLSIYLVYTKVKAETILIPDTAIRLRVIPNSNSVSDVIMKEKVVSYLEDNVYSLLVDADTIEEAREVINNNVEVIDENIDNIFINNNYNMNYKILYGSNYFPTKEYKGITYEEGYYESLVVEIGEAKGDNWWCVLFPTLCLLEVEDTTDVEYKLWVNELLKKIF